MDDALRSTLIRMAGYEKRAEAMVDELNGCRAEFGFRYASFEEIVIKPEPHDCYINVWLEGPGEYVRLPIECLTDDNWLEGYRQAHQREQAHKAEERQRYLSRVRLPNRFRITPITDRIQGG